MAAPLAFTWPHALVFWATFAWVFLPEFGIIHRATATEPVPVEDRGSLHGILVGFSVALFAAFLLPRLVPRAALPGPRLAWFYAGLVVLVAGSLLRRHCFRVLGAFFKGTVTLQADHRVIDLGAYRWVRHPSYSAAFLLVLGVALAQANWLGVVVSLALAMPAYVYRAHVEEQALLATLGAPYARFLATRTRFIPHLW